jgi:hypothetical protein
VKTFLIEFRSVPDGKVCSCALIDLDISERHLAALVIADGGDFACKSCRGKVVVEKIVDRAFELGVAPEGDIEAGVIDVTADPRVYALAKHRLLKRDDVAELAAALAVSGAVH